MGLPPCLGRNAVTGGRLWTYDADEPTGEGAGPAHTLNPPGSAHMTGAELYTCQRQPTRPDCSACPARTRCVGWS